MAGTTLWQKLVGRWLPYTIISIAVLTLSTGPILVRLAQAEHMPSLAISAMRFVFAVLLLAPWVLTRHAAEIRHLSRRDIGLIGLAGVALALGLLLFFLSLEHTTVLIANLLTNTHPLWVALVEVLILKATLGRRVWAGLALALIGGALFAIAGVEGHISMGSAPVLGSVIAVVAALFASAYFILGRVVRARVSTLVYLWLALVVGTVVSLIVMLATGTWLVGYPVQAYGWVLAMTVTSQVVGQALLAYVLAHLPATFVSISLQAVVILSAVLAFLVFQEQPGPMQILAGGVILVGVVLVIAGNRPATATSS